MKEAVGEANLTKEPEEDGEVIPKFKQRPSLQVLTHVEESNGRCLATIDGLMVHGTLPTATPVVAGGRGLVVDTDAQGRPNL